MSVQKEPFLTTILFKPNYRVCVLLNHSADQIMLLTSSTDMLPSRYRMFPSDSPDDAIKVSARDFREAQIFNIDSEFFNMHFRLFQHRLKPAL
jgi:hypothetical protein